MRLLAGPDHRVLLPASVLAGASLLLFADLVARLALAPAELPIGIVTAFIGAPFFLICCCGACLMLRVEALQIRRGRKTVLADVSLDLLPGQVLALGPNGAGVTLLGALCGELHPDQGNVWLDQQALSSWSGSQRAQRLAVLPQTRPWTLRSGSKRSLAWGVCRIRPGEYVMTKSSALCCTQRTSGT